MKLTFKICLLILIIFFSVLLNAQKAFNDTIVSESDSLIIHVLGHASVFFEYKNLKIYADPYSKVYNFKGMPKADLILITHQHSDHFDTTAINNIYQTNTIVIYTKTCADTKFYHGIDTILANGDSISVLNIDIKATPAYNLVKTQHPKGIGNGYIVTIGTKRIYLSGDTEEIPEMQEIKNIDVAFLGYSQPYDMTTTMITDVALEIKPKKLIPYHYDSSDPTPIITALTDYPEIQVLTGIKSEPVGIKPDKQLRNIQVYYNNSSKTILFKNNNQALNVSIFNLEGKMVFTRKNIYNNLNIGFLTKNVYILKFIIGSEMGQMKIIIK
jgi:L-ascorbate metabolism protein UlaG (beta-lactamase superfamily)